MLDTGKQGLSNREKMRKLIKHAWNQGTIKHEGETRSWGRHMGRKTQDMGAQDWHLLPPPGRRVPLLNNIQRGGGVGTRYRTHGGTASTGRHGGSVWLGGHGGAGDSGGHGGTGSPEGQGGTGSSGGHGGTGSPGGYGRTGSLGRHGGIGSLGSHGGPAPTAGPL